MGTESECGSCRVSDSAGDGAEEMQGCGVAGNGGENLENKHIKTVLINSLKSVILNIMCLHVIQFGKLDTVNPKRQVRISLL